MRQIVALEGVRFVNGALRASPAPGAYVKLTFTANVGGWVTINCGGLVWYWNCRKPGWLREAPPSPDPAVCGRIVAAIREWLEPAVWPWERRPAPSPEGSPAAPQRDSPPARPLEPVNLTLP